MDSGIGKEPFFKSRRVWAAVLSGIGAFLLALFPEYGEAIALVTSSVASVLAGWSWLSPK